MRHSKKYTLNQLVLSIIILIVLYALIRGTFTKLGDFQGYVLVGNLVIENSNIYANPLINTWPPFFSVFCVPIAMLDNFNTYLSKFIWLLGSIVAMYFVISYTIRLSLNQRINIFNWNPGSIQNPNTISIADWIVIIPVLISLRFVWSNIGNIQINIYMLLMALLSLYFFSKDKPLLASLFLALSISIKIYTVFLLLYFVIKREHKIVFYTLLFCALFALIPFVVFGVKESLDYYLFWFNNCLEPFATVSHKNQSYFSMMRSLLIHESPSMNGPLRKEIYVNLVNLSINQVKVISYAVLAIFSLPVIYLFRTRLKEMDSMKVFLEFSFILTLIPILSPLSWKAYFIFLFTGYFVNYIFLYRYKNIMKPALRKLSLIFFYTSIVLTVVSSELFVGRTFSDLMEVFSSLTIGTILLAFNHVLFYCQYDPRVSEN